MPRKRPPANTGLRLAPFAKRDLDSLLAAVVMRGYPKKQDDLVAVLILRAAATLIGDDDGLDDLGDEMRSYRIKANKVGF
ncbi:MAG: hypothetical protein E6F94_01180 [Actinobacteria bacterium]|nr:MAG: hypothetical protein E6F94_01180 [Actinomycetota bacterium]